MELLESAWFFKMVEQHGSTPAARLVAVFTVAGQWVSAPGIREMFAAQAGRLHAAVSLKNWLADTAAAAKADHPGMLASQLTILLQGALAEELRTPGSQALADAAKAAEAVVANACRGKRRYAARYAIAASLALVSVGATLAWHAHSPAPATVMTAEAPVTVAYRVSAQPTGVSPAEMEAVLNLQERIERGICPPPNLLQLPQGQATAYLNAVNFRTPENPEADRRNIRAFLAWFEEARARECYFSPHNGHTQTVWR